MPTINLPLLSTNISYPVPVDDSKLSTHTFNQKIEQYELVNESDTRKVDGALCIYPGYLSEIRLIYLFT